MTEKQKQTLPPGPFPLPLIGNVHLVGKRMPYSMEHLRKKYGGVYTLFVPSGNFVVGNNVITNALHMYGDGVKTAENRVLYEVKQLMTCMEGENETAFCPMEYLSQAITNVTTSWLVSERCEPGDPIFKTLREFVDNVLYVSHQWTNIDFLPFYEYLPFDISRRFRQTKQVRDEYFGKLLKEHRETYQSGEVRDIADALLAAYEKEEVEGKGKDIGTIDDITTIMMDFFIASSDTTTATLSWFILYMVLHEKVQKRVHEELDLVVGRDRTPCWKDAENLPFLHAVICETIRHASPVPLLGRKTLRDTTIKEYQIPRDTKILLNMWYVNNDPQEWNEPLSFNPDRFLDESGKFRGWNTSASFYPFGAGIRSCLGQSLAKMNLLLVASNLLHHFQFNIPCGEAEPSSESQPGGVCYPKQFLLCAIKRK
ncbi:steroid 17-alpha-hydroxylase/17,20 lyase-like [Dendronephthya gigantea]|uniref:steroid 17-alpha-hydroxylase/17,20 lyase-like n=1 Tax=Dendronephthya gigantea TaxID=151771 RepID=UPI00106CD75C|nr:steroid 17-alpha-hydroxylase/17,20 lyase-like [Dendronephthya gigantea]